MLVQGLAFEKLVTTKTLTNKLIMHQDRAVGKSPAGLCRCFGDVVKHYTNPGDIVLDPFMGGGVTVIESLRARRRVVGVDLNPMA